MAHKHSKNVTVETICFLCSKLVIITGKKPDGQGEYETDTGKIVDSERLLNSLKIKHFCDKTEDTPKLAKSLCHRCSIVAVQLTKLLDEQEVIQMKINFVAKHLDELIALECGVNDLSLQQEEDILRRLIRQKCSSMLKATPTMRVHLPRLEISQENVHDTNANILVDAVVTRTRSHSKAVCGDTSNTELQNASESPNTNDVEGSRLRIQRKVKRKMKFDLGTSALNVEKHNKRRNRTPSSKPTCLYCGNSYCNQQSLLDHMTYSHLEQYFISCKSPILSIDQFKTYCVHLLNNEMSFGHFGGTRDNTEKEKGENVHFKCCYCPYISYCVKSTPARVHLVTKHRNVLIEKLIDLQNSTKLIGIPNVSRGASAKLNLHFSDGTTIPTKQIRCEHTCKICEAKTTDVKKHKAIHHFEEFFISEKPTDMTKETFRRYCSHLLDSEFQGFKQVKVNSKSGNVDKYQCPRCSKLYGEKLSSRNHIIFAHAKNITKDLGAIIKTLKPEQMGNGEIKIGESSSGSSSPPKRTKRSMTGVLPCKVCGISLTRRGWVLHMKQKHPQEYLQVKCMKLTCPRCTKEFTNKQSLRIHLSKTLRCNSSFHTPSTMRLTPATSEDKTFKCTECNKSYTTRKTVRLHKILIHPETYFKSSNSSNVSTQKFKNYCHHLIELEMHNVTQTILTNGKVMFKCNYCPKRCSNKRALRTHVIPVHRTKLAKILEELQKCTESSLIRKVANIKAQNNLARRRVHFWACDKCPAIFSEKTALQNHNRFNCKFQNQILALSVDPEESQQSKFDDKEHLVLSEKAAFEETHFEATQVFCSGSAKMEAAGFGDSLKEENAGITMSFGVGAVDQMGEIDFSANAHETILPD